MPMKKPKEHPDVSAIIGMNENYLYWNANTVPPRIPKADPTRPPTRNPLKNCLLIDAASPNILFFFLSHLVNGLFISSSSFYF